MTARLLTLQRLKQCPFCKKRRAEVILNQKGFYFASCWNGCFCRTGYCMTESDAIKKWNTRK